jgi:hypothetical protein
MLLRTIFLLSHPYSTSCVVLILPTHVLLAQGKENHYIICGLIPQNGPYSLAWRNTTFQKELWIVQCVHVHVWVCVLRPSSQKVLRKISCPYSKLWDLDLLES